jgi:hypothetical protein
VTTWRFNSAGERGGDRPNPAGVDRGRQDLQPGADDGGNREAQTRQGVRHQTVRLVDVRKGNNPLPSEVAGASVFKRNIPSPVIESFYLAGNGGDLFPTIDYIDKPDFLPLGIPPSAGSRSISTPSGRSSRPSGRSRNGSPMKKRRISGTKAPESILGINAPIPPNSAGWSPASIYSLSLFLPLDKTLHPNASLHLDFFFDKRQTIKQYCTREKPNSSNKDIKSKGIRIT